MSSRKTRSSTSTSEDTNDDFWTKSSSTRETVVKLREGNGSPLIILHGGGGTIHAFSPLKRNFTSALWGIQVTPDTPPHSLQAQCQFYFEKIKAEQATGPYRICGFSGSSILAVVLVKLFESNGDKVAQLSFIDHFPTTFLAPIFGLDISQTHLEHPDARQAFLDADLQNLFTITRRDGRGNLPKRHKLANDLQDAYRNLPTSPFIENFCISLDRFLNQVFDFLLQLKKDACIIGDDQPGKEFLEKWLKSVKAPVTAYLATYGMLGSLTHDKHPSEEWYDLGIHRCFPNAKVTVLDAGHYDILENPGLISGLQEDYRVYRPRL